MKPEIIRPIIGSVVFGPAHPTGIIKKTPVRLEPRKADTHTKIEIVKAFLRELSAEHRLEAMSEVCEYCGDLRPKGGCNCMRDE